MPAASEAGGRRTPKSRGPAMSSRSFPENTARASPLPVARNGVRRLGVWHGNDARRVPGDGAIGARPTRDGFVAAEGVADGLAMERVAARTTSRRKRGRRILVAAQRPSSWHKLGRVWEKKTAQPSGMSAFHPAAIAYSVGIPPPPRLVNTLLLVLRRCQATLASRAARLRWSQSDDDSKPSNQGPRHGYESGRVDRPSQGGCGAVVGRRRADNADV